MTITKPVNSGYSVILGSTTGSNGSKVDTWLEYKVLSQSIELNQSTVRVILYSQATFDSSTAHTVTRQFGYVKIDSNQQDYTMTGGYDFDNYKLNKFADYTFTVSHNANGTKTVAMSGAWSDSGWSSFINGGSASASVTLPTIPQYASCTISNTSKTETSAVIKWTTDQTVDHVWYSTNGGTSYTDGGSVNATTGTIKLSGLSVNTTYSVKVKVRNKSSQLQSESSALSVKTYNYPYATTMPDFIIGDKVTIQFQNPLGREFTFTVKVGNTTITNTWTISGTSYSGLNGSSTVTQLYATIPNTTSATYSIVCTYDGHTVTKSGGTVSVNANICVPSVSAVTYADVNSSVTSITGDSSKIVQGKSTVRYTVTGATGNYSATVSSVQVFVNGSTYTLSKSGNDYVGGDASIDSASNVQAVAVVTDSRGLSRITDVTVSMVAYALPSAIISLERHNNYYSESDINVDADYVSIGSNTVTITYKAKKKGTSSWTVTGSLSDNVTSTLTLDNTYAWDVQVNLTDSFSGSKTYNLSLQRGMPIVYFDRLRESVGINCFPQNDQSLEINGVKAQSLFAIRGDEQIPANADLNNYTTAGVYYCSSSANTQSLSHTPYTEGIWIDGTTGFRLEVYITTGTGYGLQILYTHNVVQRTYIRSLNGGTWRAWHRIIGDDEVYYRHSDTLSITTYTNLNGFITSSTTSVSFSFYTPKSLANISTITVTAFKGTLRGGSGYLDGQTSAYDWFADASYTLTATKITDNMIRIVCTKTSAYSNVTNNTPVSYYGSLGLSFSTT